jgi:hypothetical protein
MDIVGGQGIIMVKFRFSVILLCVILPPVLYILSLQFLENQAEKRLQSALEATYLGNTRLLYDGSQTIQRAIQKNVNRTLARSRWIAWGGKASVTVKTRQNTLLYPLAFDDYGTSPDLDSTPLEIATENFRLISEGLELSLVFKLPHNTLLTNSILGTLILLSLGALYLYYRHWNTQYRRETAGRMQELDRLLQVEQRYSQQLDVLKDERARMAADIEQMKTQVAKEKEKASSTEEEMLAELIALEGQIAEKEDFQKQQLEKIRTLQEKLDALTQPAPKESNRKQKPVEAARKRLTTLYKNLTIHDRAVEGYISLPEELKLRCEEVIVQLNDAPSSVQIKRKVFGKKNRVTVLEVVFGYKGRLYFRAKGENQADLLAIGTKNTQQQDLAFLERL